MLLVICILTAAVCSRLGQGHTAIIIHFALSGSRWLPVLASLVWAVGWYALLAPALGLPTSWGWCSFALFTLLTTVVRRPKAISICWGLLQVATHQSGLVMRDMDSLLAEAQTLLCLLVALQCAQELIQRLGNILCRSHGTDGSGEAVAAALTRALTRALTPRVTT